MSRADHFTEVTEQNQRRDIYSDFLVDFSVHPDKNDLLRNTNENAVKRSIKNLVLTNTYERFFAPNIGGDVNRLLFELATPETAFILQKRISNVIIQYEPRCRLIEVVVTPYEEQNAYVVTITFQVLNRDTPIQMQVLLNRVR